MTIFQWGNHMDDRTFQLILTFLELSWPGYRRVRKGVKKRLARHMRECGYRSVSEYLGLLGEAPAAKKTAERLLTVSISRFFRDSDMWEALEARLVSRWAEAAKRSSVRPFRVWSAGCSCGEEIYSLKILWMRLERQLPNIPPLAVWAGDVNPEVLEKAEDGVYPRSSVRNLSAETLEEAFTATSKKITIRPFLKKGIRWLQHDFMSDPPPTSNVDLIFLRNNLLTYYLPPVMLPAFSRIIAALRTGGLLVVGLKEATPLAGLPLKPRPEHPCIFEKTTDSGQAEAAPREDVSSA
jgi:chemotaxis protein methyltransferase CheR